MDKGHYNKMISKFGLNSCKIPCCPIVKHNDAEFLYVIFNKSFKVHMKSLQSTALLKIKIKKC